MVPPPVDCRQRPDEGEKSIRDGRDRRDERQPNDADGDRAPVLPRAPAGARVTPPANRSATTPMCKGMRPPAGTCFRPATSTPAPAVSVPVCAETAHTSARLLAGLLLAIGSERNCAALGGGFRLVAAAGAIGRLLLVRLKAELSLPEFAPGDRARTSWNQRSHLLRRRGDQSTSAAGARWRRRDLWRAPSTEAARLPAGAASLGRSPPVSRWPLVALGTCRGPTRHKR